jgi:hypothetical protein
MQKLQAKEKLISEPRKKLMERSPPPELKKEVQ